MAIYTRTGDGGMTSVRGGDRVSKGGWQMGVLGSLDEVNSELGMAAAVVKSFEVVYEGKKDDALADLIGGLREIRERMEMVQGELLEMGALIAENRDLDLSDQHQSVDVDARSLQQPNGSPLRDWFERVERLEGWIDEAEDGLPELHNFILPGGSVGAASLMVARSVVRRGERDMVRWVGSLSRKSASRGRSDTKEYFEYWKPVLSYVNRLSDWLFMLGRRVNWLVGEEELVWKGK